MKLVQASLSACNVQETYISLPWKSCKARIDLFKCREGPKKPF